MYVIIEAKKLRNLMNKRILCAETLSQRAGVSISCISHILSKGDFVRVQDKPLARIAEALGVVPESLTADLQLIEAKRDQLERELGECESALETKQAQPSIAKRKARIEKELAYIAKLI